MNRSKRKGTDWENEVVAALQRAGFLNAERRTQGGKNDRGDVAGIPDAVIEAKDEAGFKIGTWIGEAERERANAKARIAAVWFKRRGKSKAEDAYVVMEGRHYLAMLQAWTGRDQLGGAA